MSAATKFANLHNPLPPAARAESEARVQMYLDGLVDADDALATGRITLDRHDYFIDELHAACWSDGTTEAVQRVRAELAQHTV